MRIINKLIGAVLGATMAIGIGVGIWGGHKDFTPVHAAESYDFTGDTITFADQGLENGVQYTTAFTNGTTNITFGGGGNDGKYYTTGSGMRTYGGGTITISSSVVMTQLNFTWSGNYKPEADVASPTGYSTSTNAWTGSSQNVVLTRPSGSGHWRLQKIKITTANTPILDSISITGQLEKTTFNCGEGWSHAGLSVMGTYSDDSEEEITSGISWSYNPSATVLGTTSLTITATVGELTATHTEAVTIQSVVSPFVNDTAYKMFFYSTAKEANYYFIGSMSGYYGATSTTRDEGVDVYFEANGNGQNLYFLDGTTKNYITVEVSGTHINFVYSSAVPTITWYYNGTTIIYTIDTEIYSLGTSGNYVTFGAYKSYYSSNYYAQFELTTPQSDDISAWCTSFLATVTCDGGVTPPSATAWGQMKTSFLALSSEDQLTLKTLNNDATARYDYIVAKYGANTYEDFIDRNPAPLASSARIFFNTPVQTTSFTIVIITATVIGIIVGSWFVIKRKKKLN